MNENTFAEELKTKREEYGITQTRIAVACGISREYYNRIENGKTNASEELKAEICKQLERLNPLEPMFILIDYFRVRFPTTDPLTVIKDILHIKPRHMLHEEYGRYGYEEQYILGDIIVLVSSNPSLGVLLELKGKGCRQMEAYLIAQQRSWFDLMMDCLTSDGVMKRLDLAINDMVGILNIPKLIEKYQRGECISYFRKQKRYDGTDKNGDDMPEPFTLEKAIQWLHRQVAPTLKMVQELDKMSHTTILDDMLEHTELKDKHRHLLELERTSIEERIDTAVSQENDGIF